MMKKKGLTTVLFVIGSVVVLVLFAVIVFSGNKITVARRGKTDNYSISNVGGVDGPKVAHSTMQVLEKISGTEESSYRVGATLPGTDFSSMGQILADKLTQEWNTYDSMTREQRLASSKLWGVVGIQTDTWKECEEAIGFTVYNPLETLDWLNKTGYFGMEGTNTSTPAKHIQVTANSTQAANRKLGEINVTAGYSTDSVRVTLTAILTADAGTFTIGSVCNGYATYEQNVVTTGSGVPVLIMTTNETNNTGYYDGDYFDPTVYWVKDNVFYILRVFGDEKDKAEIQAILERILAGI